MNDLFIDVTILEPRMKHATIFDAFDKAAAGNAVVIHNDHDPKPLYYQLLGERGNCFSWTYLASGPEIWEVEIRKNPAGVETLGEIAGKDMRKAELLKKLGIDFSCGGKRSLEEACSEQGLDVTQVKEELRNVSVTASAPQLDFNSFPVSFLADYIVNVHHSFISKNLPVIGELAQKSAERHGDSMPFLINILQKTKELSGKLTRHLQEEEQTLFPLIRLFDSGNAALTEHQSLRVIIGVMEKDHSVIGALLKELRNSSHDYVAPSGACDSVVMLFQKLKSLEDELLRHIHLENNILFPKALKMERGS